MRTWTRMFAIALMAGCGGHGEHEFATYAECYEHGVEEGETDPVACLECDEVFEIEHADAPSCVTDHEEDVSDGVPQNAIVEHCATFE